MQGASPQPGLAFAVSVAPDAKPMQCSATPGLPLAITSAQHSSTWDDITYMSAHSRSLTIHCPAC